MKIRILTLERRYANKEKDLDAVERRYANEEKDLDAVNLPRHKKNEAMGLSLLAGTRYQKPSVPSYLTRHDQEVT